jgi:hypothetical protein
MKKSIILLSLFFSLFFSLFSISRVHADCMYQELEPSCNILWNTITSSCQGWSDTSSWYIPTAYQGECKETVTLDENTKEIISDYLYNLSSKKGYITSETDEYYRISSNWQEHIQNWLFPVIYQIISKEIKKSSPDLKKIAILNHFVSLVWYDYYMSK